MTEKFKIPFSGRSHTFNEEEIQVVIDALKNAKTLTQGINQIKFQEKFCKYIGTPNAFALSNAASALELSAQLCQFNDGDEVVIPGHTYTASAYPFLKEGAKIVWADIDLETRVVNAETIERCITPKTKAIVVVHLYGYGADMPTIMELARRYNLLVIEDAAQALGVEIEGKMAGTYGDFGIFSFHSHKNITTLGEGGMITVKDNKMADIIPMLRHNGHCSFGYDREYYWKPAMGNVDLPELGGEYLWPNNYCLSEVQCAIGIKLLDRIKSINEKKRKRAISLIDSMADYAQIEFHRVNSERHNYHLLVARMTNGRRDEFINKMIDEGIQCVVQYYPLYRYDLYKKVEQGEANCPNTDLFFDNMVSFPFQSMMSDEDFEKIIEATKRSLV